MRLITWETVDTEKVQTAVYGRPEKHDGKGPWAYDDERGVVSWRYSPSHTTVEYYVFPWHSIHRVSVSEDEG